MTPKVYLEPDCDHGNEIEWPTEVSDKLLAFVRSMADVARKHSPTFKT